MGNSRKILVISLKIRGQGFGSSTRAIYGGGIAPSGNNVNTIDFVTIATQGNATDFGDLTSRERSR